MKTLGGRHDRERVRASGFTLIELGIVIMIIGLLTSFILIVSMQGIERAKERATQSLIAKLDTLVQDRLQVIQAQQVNANLAHQWFAWPENLALTTGLPPASQRADVIARVDYMRAEMPDVFFVQVNPASLSTSSAAYPLNFGSLAYPLGNTPVPPQLGGPASPHFAHVLPLGNAVGYEANNPNSPQRGAVPYTTNPAGWFPPPGYNPTGTGIYGASYTAAAGILKNLGSASAERIGTAPAPYLPAGYDGVDNNGNNLVDEFMEGVNPSNLQAVTACLENHRRNHHTARSEALYAFLVESPGALVSRDSFKDSEVADTDGDGLPEFIDAWGNPLLFFRWPTHYHSPIQRGINPDGFDGIDNNGNGSVDEYAEAAVYLNISENREVNGLDPNNALVSPIWWSDLGNAPQYPNRNGKAAAFQTLFFPLVEPLATTGTIDSPPRWDRAGYFKRRNFQTRFLILSAGPDAEPGVFRYPDAVVAAAPADPTTMSTRLIRYENVAGGHAMDDPAGSNPAYPLGPISDYLGQVPARDPATTQRLITVGQDDVTNHNLKASGVSVQ